MVTPELNDYVKVKLDAGERTEAIKAELQQAGWASADIEEALKVPSISNQNNPPTHRSKKKIISISGLVILLLLIGSAGFAYFKYKNKKPLTEAEQIQKFIDDTKKIQESFNDKGIVVEDNQKPGNKVIISSIKVENNGFAAIELKRAARIIGQSSLLKPGTYTNLEIQLSEYIDGEALSADFFNDDGDGVFDKHNGDSVYTQTKDKWATRGSGQYPALVKREFQMGTVKNNKAYYSPQLDEGGWALIAKAQTPGNKVVIESLELKSTNSYPVYVPGFVVIQKDAHGVPGDVIGSSDLLTSGHSNLEVNLNTNISNEIVYASLYQDSDGNKVFNLSKDKAFVGINNQVITLKLPVIGPNGEMPDDVGSVKGNIYSNKTYKYQFEMPSGWEMPYDNDDYVSINKITNDIAIKLKANLRVSISKENPLDVFSDPQQKTTLKSQSTKTVNSITWSIYVYSSEGGEALVAVYKKGDLYFTISAPKNEYTESVFSNILDTFKFTQ